MNVPFLNIAAQTAALREASLAALQGVLDQAHFILGPNVAAFESEMAARHASRFGIGVNSGSDALTLALKALDIGPGDEVVTTPFTYIAPAESIHQLGARIVFSDIDPQTFCLNPAQLERRITPKTKAIIPVHLFGQAAPIREICQMAARHRLHVVEDCAQAVGAAHQDQPVGTFGQAGCFSFYPTKNLGANGDGGMIITQDEALDKKLRMLRVHGIEKRYHHDLHGFNSRLDEIQAALLRIKLPHLTAWNRRRAEIAGKYSAGLAGLPLTLPVTAPGNLAVHHVYAVLTEKRDALQQFLADHGVGTLIYYPIPLHLQKVYADLGYQPGDMPVAEAVSKTILPLPIYPELADDQVDYVISVIRQFPF